MSKDKILEIVKILTSAIVGALTVWLTGCANTKVLLESHPHNGDSNVKVEVDTKPEISTDVSSDSTDLAFPR